MVCTLDHTLQMLDDITIKHYITLNTVQKNELNTFPENELK